MLSCLGVGPDSLPHPPPPPHLVHGQGLTPHDEGDLDSMRATLDREPHCGASFSQMLDKNKIFNQTITGSLVKRFDDIKKAVNPYSHLPLPGTSKFYIEDMRQEDDNFFEDMTNLHSNQHKLFEQSCEQVKDVYKVDIVDSTSKQVVSPFGEVSKIGGEELYVEVLFCLIHMLGADKKTSNSFELVEHLRKAFQIEPKEHLKLYSETESFPVPRVKLSLCFVEARDLVPKDISGKSNPYCTFYTSSSKFSPRSTSCKSQTLSPVWDETFTLDVELAKTSAEHLHIDVWNFEPPDDGFVDKLKRVGEIRDSRGLKLFLSDTVTPGETGDKLMGHVDIDLNQLPSCGENKWWPLYKVDGKQRKKRGEIHLIQHLFVRENQLDSHVRLLKVLMSSELVRRRLETWSWRDNFTRETLEILAQHAVQSRMTRVDTALAREVHSVFPLDCRVFLPILEKLREPILTNRIKDHLVKRFHETSENLADQLITFVRKHRLYIGNNSSKYKTQLEAILQCLHILHTLKWRTRNDIVLQVEAALLASVREWFNFVMEKIPRIEASHHGEMRNLTKITYLLMADIQESKELYQSVFWTHLNVDYMEIAYREFDQNLTLITKRVIDQACDDMKPILFDGRENQPGIKSNIDTGTSLFELYLALKQFYTLGFTYLKISGKTGSQDYTVFHSWFHKAVAKWLDLALHKAMIRIVRSVEKDDLVPVDPLSQHTSSAVDLKTILNQIRIFWNQLSWPDVETNYVFISRIMDDVCKAIIFYAEKMCNKAEEQKRNASCQRNVLVDCNRGQCLAVNNIDLVMNYLNPFITNLGIDSVLDKLEKQKGPVVADTCRKTIRTLLKNSIENVENQILTILEDVGSRMSPTIEQVLAEGYENQRRDFHSDCHSLLNYLDENLIFLKSHMVPANFDRVLSALWAASASSLAENVHKGVERKEPARYFVFLFETFKILLNFFYGDKIPEESFTLSTKRLLELYASDSESLIVSFYKQRLADQKANSSNHSTGSITVKIQVLSEHLRVNIMNCRHLKPGGNLRRSRSEIFKQETRFRSRSCSTNKSNHSHNNNLNTLRDKCHSFKMSVSEARQSAHRRANQGMCCPYVTVKLVPGKPGSGSDCRAKFKTISQPRTLFPIFDETFDIQLPKKIAQDKTFLLFSVKDRGPLGDKILLGEALVCLSELRRCDQGCHMQDMAQIHLPLSLPSTKIIDILTALNTRRSSLDRGTKKWLQQQQKNLFL